MQLEGLEGEMGKWSIELLSEALNDKANLILYLTSNQPILEFKLLLTL